MISCLEKTFSLEGITQGNHSIAITSKLTVLSVCTPDPGRVLGTGELQAGGKEEGEDGGEGKEVRGEGK